MSANGDQPYVDLLTGREQDVLDLLAQGKSNRELAAELVLSLNTVKWYARQVYAKLGVANREEAVARATTSPCSSRVSSAGNTSWPKSNICSRPRAS